jgi:hypothetical protein
MDQRSEFEVSDEWIAARSNAEISEATATVSDATANIIESTARKIVGRLESALQEGECPPEMRRRYWHAVTLAALRKLEDADGNG